MTGRAVSLPSRRKRHKMEPVHVYTHTINGKKGIIPIVSHFKLPFGADAHKSRATAI